MLVTNATASQIQLRRHSLSLGEPLDELPTSVFVLLGKDDSVEVVWYAGRIRLALDKGSVRKDAVCVIRRNDVDQRSRVSRQSRMDGMLMGQDDFQLDKLAVDLLVVLMNLSTVLALTSLHLPKKTYHVDMSPIVLSDLTRRKIISFDLLHVATKRISLRSNLHADI